MRTLTIVLVATALLSACVSVGPQSAVGTRPAPEPVAPSAPAEPEAPVAVAQPVPVVRGPAPVAAVRIDNTSLATFRASWQQLYDSVSPTERVKLNNAASLIAFSPYRGMTQLPLNLTRSPIVPEMIRDQIHGLTYPQIIELSKQPAERSEPRSP